MASLALAGTTVLAAAFVSEGGGKQEHIQEQGVSWVMHLGHLGLSGPILSQNSATKAETSTTTTLPPTTTTTTPPPANESGWLLVHQCEGVAWDNPGPLHYGGLGFTEKTWLGAGGAMYAPNAAEATPNQQMTIANNVEPPPFSDTPDGGCHGW